jgi:hypothetical protein
LAFDAWGEGVVGEIDAAEVGGHFEGESFHFADLVAEAVAPGFEALGLVFDRKANGFERAGLGVNGDGIAVDVQADLSPGTNRKFACKRMIQ